MYHTVESMVRNLKKKKIIEISRSRKISVAMMTFDKGSKTAVANETAAASEYETLLCGNFSETNCIIANKRQ